jgi:D-alanine-D-alanine ligase
MKVLLICHESLIPPEKCAELTAESKPWRTEFFISQALLRLGHDVQICGLSSELAPLKFAIKKIKPDIVFNLLEEFANETLLEFFVVNFLDDLKIPYTGCSAESLILCKNKILTKSLLASKNVPVPRNNVFPKIVKYNFEESSYGITDESIVIDLRQEEKLKKKLLKNYSWSHEGAVLAEEYIDGKELHVAAIPDYNVRNNYKFFEVWETQFGTKKGPRMMTEKMKWNFKWRAGLSARLVKARGLSSADKQKIQHLSLIALRTLSVDGPVRLDFRWNKSRGPVLIEVNPNPDLAKWDEYSAAAKSSGVKYDLLVQHILDLGIYRHSMT